MTFSGVEFSSAKLILDRGMLLPLQDLFDWHSRIRASVFPHRRKMCRYLCTNISLYGLSSFREMIVCTVLGCRKVLYNHSWYTWKKKAKYVLHVYSTTRSVVYMMTSWPQALQALYIWRPNFWMDSWSIDRACSCLPAYTYQSLS